MMTSKREKFEQLDELVLDAMTEALTKGDTDILRDLNVAVTYLKNNAQITPPTDERGVGDQIQDLIQKN